MKLPHIQNQEKYDPVNLISIVVSAAVLLVIVTLLFWYYQVISESLMSAVIDSLGIITTVLFISATLLSVSQNRQSLQRFEKEHYQHLAEMVKADVVHRCRYIFADNAEEIDSGEVMKYELRSELGEIELEITDPVKTLRETLTEDNPKLDLDMNSVSDWSVSYRTFKQSYPELEESLRNYEDLYDTTVNTSNELSDRCREFAKEWLTNRDLGRYRCTNSSGEERTVEDVIRDSPKDVDYIAYEVSILLMQEYLPLNKMVSHRGQRVYESLNDELMSDFESEFSEEISAFNQVYQDLTTETEKLSQEFLEVESNLVIEYGFKDE